METIRLENTLRDLIAEVRLVASLATSDTTSKPRIVELLHYRADRAEQMVKAICGR
jgi:hypothetical protein